MAKLEALRGDCKERWRTPRLQGPFGVFELETIRVAGVVYVQGSLALISLEFLTLKRCFTNNGHVEFKTFLSDCQSSHMYTYGRTACGLFFSKRGIRRKTLEL